MADVNEKATEYLEGEWREPTLDGPEPWAVVTHGAEVGWVWWAQGRMGNAESYADACAQAEAMLQKLSAPSPNREDAGQ